MVDIYCLLLNVDIVCYQNTSIYTTLRQGRKEGGKGKGKGGRREGKGKSKVGGKGKRRGRVSVKLLLKEKN